MRARIETEMLWITIRTQEINFSVTTTTLGSREPQLRPHEQVCAFSGRAFVFPASPTAHVISNFQYYFSTYACTQMYSILFQWRFSSPRQAQF